MKKGVQFHRFPEEELALWQNASPDFFSDFIRQMKAKGKEDAARDTVELWQKMRREIECR